MGKKQKRETKYKNILEYNNTLNDLKTSFLNLFEWEGLPETCNEYILESYLMNNGKAMMAEYEGAYIILTASPSTDINIYGQATKAWGTGKNGFNKLFNLYIDGADISSIVTDNPVVSERLKPNAVLCKDNAECYPYINILEIGAEKLTDASRTSDVIARSLKSPVILTIGDERSKRSVEEMMKDVDRNIPYIIGTGDLPVNRMEVLNMGATGTNLDAIWKYKENVKNELRESLGLDNNPAPSKRERLLTDEIEANDETTHLNLAKRLKERELFCERVNKCFGLNISVKVKETENNEEQTYEEDFEDEQPQ